MCTEITSFPRFFSYSINAENTQNIRLTNVNENKNDLRRKSGAELRFVQPLPPMRGE